MREYPVVEWESFYRRLRINPGEHVIYVSPTGGGKSTLMGRVLARRKFVLMLVTKLRDVTLLREFKDKGYTVARDWRDVVLQYHAAKMRGRPPHIMLWPLARSTTLDTVRHQRQVFATAFDRVYRHGGWTLVVDEEHYMCEMLGLDTSIKLYLHQSRSSSITMMNGIQRPAFVPLVTYSGSTHAFLWRTTDEDDLRRISKFGGANRKELAIQLDRLDEHQFVYLNTRRSNARPVISEVRL